MLVASLAAILVMFGLVPGAFAAEKTVGLIVPGDSPYYAEVQTAFQEKLRKSIHVDYAIQRPFPDPISLSNAARKLIATDVDVIVAFGSAAAAAALQERPPMPLVYVAVYEPLAQQFRGKKVSGVSANVPVTSLVRYLRNITPVKSLGVVYNQNEPDSNQQYLDVGRLASQYGFTVEPMNLAQSRNPAAYFAGKKVDAVFVTGTALSGSVLASLKTFGREQRIPVAALFGVKTGDAVVALSASPREQGERAADKVARVLEGASAERVGTETAKETELIFNMKESIAIGCRIPMELVTEATTLIK